MACGKVQIYSWPFNGKNSFWHQARLFWLLVTEKNTNPFKQEGKLVILTKQHIHTQWEESQL